MLKLDTPSTPEVHRKLTLRGTVLSIKRVQGLVKETLETGEKDRVKELQGELEEVLKSSEGGAYRLIETIGSQVRILGKWLAEDRNDGVTGVHFQKCLSKEAFLKTLDQHFTYGGKRQTVREALASAIFQKDAHWIYTTSSILRAYNEEFPSALGFPTSHFSIAACLKGGDEEISHGKKHTSLKKQEFIDICALDPEGKHKAIPFRERFLQALEKPSQKESSKTLRGAIQDALQTSVKTHWFGPISTVLKTYNSSVQYAKEKLSTHLQTFGRNLVGLDFLTRDQFGELCGIPLDTIPLKKQKATQAKKIPLKRPKITRPDQGKGKLKKITPKAITKGPRISQNVPQDPKIGAKTISGDKNPPQTEISFFPTEANPARIPGDVLSEYGFDGDLGFERKSYGS